VTTKSAKGRERKIIFFSENIFRGLALLALGFKPFSSPPPSLSSSLLHPSFLSHPLSSSFHTLSPFPFPHFSHSSPPLSPSSPPSLSVTVSLHRGFPTFPLWDTLPQRTPLPRAARVLTRPLLSGGRGWVTNQKSQSRDANRSSERYRRRRWGKGKRERRGRKAMGSGRMPRRTQTTFHRHGRRASKKPFVNGPERSRRLADQAYYGALGHSAVPKRPGSLCPAHAAWPWAQRCAHGQPA
jgi:hypothetical protein